MHEQCATCHPRQMHCPLRVAQGRGHASMRALRYIWAHQLTGRPYVGPCSCQAFRMHPLHGVGPRCLPATATVVRAPYGACAVPALPCPEQPLRHNGPHAAQALSAPPRPPGRPPRARYACARARASRRLCRRSPVAAAACVVRMGVVVDRHEHQRPGLGLARTTHACTRIPGGGAAHLAPHAVKFVCAS